MISYYLFKKIKQQNKKDIILGVSFLEDLNMYFS